MEGGPVYSSRKRVQIITAEVDANKRSHKDQRGAQSFIKAELVGPAFELVVEPDVDAADNLRGGMGIS